MDNCANPDCMEPPLLANTRVHWVQVEEVRLIGREIGEGPAQRRFAAVTCSKRCAIAVLTAAADAEDAAKATERDRMDRLYEQP